MLVLLAIARAAVPLERCVESGLVGPLDAVVAEGVVRGSLADPAAALLELDRLTLAWPSCDALWMARAAAQHALGRDDHAVVSLQRAVAVKGGPEAERALAVALHRQGRGGAFLRAAVASSPDDPLLKILAARELSPSARVDALREAERAHPDREDVVVELVLSLRDAGRPQEAVRVGRASKVDSPRLRALVDTIEAPFVERVEVRPQRPSEVRTLADGTEEIVVYSPGRAKAAVLKRLEVLGYTAAEEVDGGVRYRSERPVSPYVDVFDDGRVEVQEKGWVKPAPVAPGQTMIPVISERKLRPDRIRVMESIAYEVTAWQQALRLETFQQEVDERLPDRLTALWERGEPLYGSGDLPTLRARRDALVAHWASRACNGDGDYVRAVVVRFLRNVVQESEVALTAEEVRAATATSACPDRTLDL